MIARRICIMLAVLATVLVFSTARAGHDDGLHTITCKFNDGSGGGRTFIYYIQPDVEAALQELINLAEQHVCASITSIDPWSCLP